MDNVIYIDEFLADCVAKASTKLLPSLQESDLNITGIHWQHGHPLEIIETLKQLSTGVSSKTQRYPLFGLFRDFKETMGTQPGIYSEAPITIIIATRTLPTYSSDQRKEKSFKPILHPIMVEVFNQIELSGKFLNEGNDLQVIPRIDHYFWGRESIYGAKANIFSDWIDCVEINNLILKTYTNNCQ